MAYQVAARKAGDIAYRAAVGVALAAGLLLVWLVGAAGVIGEDGDPSDLLYGGYSPSESSRASGQRPARALLAAALVQALVAVIALIAGKQQAPFSSVSEIVGLNGMFVALFVGSAWLFRRAARQQLPAAAAPQDR